ncbi:hypothetical protein CVT24_013401 [Panaeolus cyanescens]|uniref:Extracellular membrane protein CFEM domain-containing protein n=1 Tax=Panaeolus cyanescens TaxID=181874 RepID=A0A409YMS3_9AGAR|nr:hypothetical protein CVT24_013401 [Panaeolus cyanescens]
MHLSLFTLATVVITTLVPGIVAYPGVSSSLSGHTGSLVSRQTSSDCQTACSDSETIVNTCASSSAVTTCLCTTQNAQTLQICINCAASAGDTTSLGDIQEIASGGLLCVTESIKLTFNLDQGFNSACKGSSVPALTVQNGPSATNSDDGSFAPTNTDGSSFGPTASGDAGDTIPLTSVNGAQLPSPTGGSSFGGSSGDGFPSGSSGTSGSLNPPGTNGASGSNNSPNGSTGNSNPSTGTSGSNTSPLVPGQKVPGGASQGTILHTFQLVASLTIVTSMYFVL